MTSVHVYTPTAKFLLTDKEDTEDMVADVKKISEDIIKILESDAAGMVIDLFVTNGHIYLSYLAKVVKGVEMLDEFIEKHEKEEPIEEKLLRNIDRSITIYALNDLESDIKSIENRVKRMMKDDLSIEDRKREVVPAFHSCQKILFNFEKTDHVFYAHPLLTTPCLIGFIRCYLSVIAIAVSIDPTYNDESICEKERLKKVLEVYKENTIDARLKIIEIIKIKENAIDFTAVKSDIKEHMKDWKTIQHNAKRMLDFDMVKERFKEKKSEFSRDLDIVRDEFGYGNKKKHTWNRKAWDQQNHTKDNLSYPMVVKMVYEAFFNDLIECI
ncbi:12763_t:CDS:1 [Ambispora leptoticha]|uniref:12763_t:CDS:1 n=1 Tax=Ambispora leptoticha TaxID=144679 RepID=A0A9N8WRE3_9GLOM|nr:12763_t:CDS:1 [Ambispora leptoticha]